MISAVGWCGGCGRPITADEWHAEPGDPEFLTECPTPDCRTPYV